MSKRQDLTKIKFTRLQPIKVIGKTKKNSLIWLCKCDCGKYTKVVADDLRKGSTKSCGCLRRERFLTHNKSDSRIYHIWSAMKSRCYNKNNLRYNDYGGRGIKVCKEWKDDFMNFYTWTMANGYEENLSIDRINNDGDYEPNNCRWTTIKEQNQHTRRTIIVSYKEKEYNLSQLSKLLNINYSKIYKWYYENILLEKIKNIRG